LRLRRAVLHPNLVLIPDDKAHAPAGDEAVDINDMIRTGEGGQNNFAEEVLANLTDAEASECPICLDVMETPMIIPECMHQW
jgi:DNA repair protein RAD5